MHCVHNGLVLVGRAAVVKGELVQAVRYGGFYRPNPFWQVGPVRLQHSGGLERVPAVIHLRNNVTIRHRDAVQLCTHLRNVAI
jgi:hypothetical protein